jgi:hypothetical protein
VLENIQSNKFRQFYTILQPSSVDHTTEALPKMSNNNVMYIVVNCHHKVVTARHLHEAATSGWNHKLLDRRSIEDTMHDVHTY